MTHQGIAHHVIVGSGPAGLIAAETLRQHAPQDTITLVGDEREPPYSRMAIPYLMAGSIDEAGTYLRKDPLHLQNLRLNRVVSLVKSIDVATKSVVFEAGASASSPLRYDSLLIATGSRALHPPIEGMDSPGVHTCWTLADARRIMALAKPGARVVQLGAGFIGCIIMEALVARGVQLSVVEMGERLVPRMMGAVAGGMIADWVRAKGVQVFTSTRIESIQHDTSQKNARLSVRLSNDQVLQADLLISAAGVRPAIGWLAGSGIACEAGVLTDAQLQTNVPGVFAAGDCAQALDRASGKHLVSAIQPNAAEQARVAALNMLAVTRGEALRAVLNCVTQINVLDTLGLISCSFGQWQGVAGGEQAELTDLARHRHVNLQFKDDVLVGCNAVGWTHHVGVMRALVEGQVRLGGWKDTLMADPTQLMPAYLASAQKQGQWSGAADARRR